MATICTYIYIYTHMYTINLFGINGILIGIVGITNSYLHMLVFKVNIRFIAAWSNFTTAQSE